MAVSASVLPGGPAIRISAVVPTLGTSELLVPCLEALRRDGGSRLEVVVVDQAPSPLVLPAGLADRMVRPGRRMGFAAAANLGIATARGELVAVVNDDLLVEPGWIAALAGALAAQADAAAAQGVNLLLAAPERADGWGLAWNRWWQAVQLGHGEAALPPEAPVREVFGVSATAALYRRCALAAVATVATAALAARGGSGTGGTSAIRGTGGSRETVETAGTRDTREPGRTGGPGGSCGSRGTMGAFDARLGSYYEDVELAGRLRGAGWRALTVPRARARHAGSATLGALPRARWRLIYGNRYLAAARLLGGGFWARLPRMAARDAADFARAALGGDGARMAGIAAGWARALRLLPAFARRGAPAVRADAATGSFVNLSS
jgi:GT2 family glycosyltransferase